MVCNGIELKIDLKIDFVFGPKFKFRYFFSNYEPHMSKLLRILFTCLLKAANITVIEQFSLKYTNLTNNHLQKYL